MMLRASVAAATVGLVLALAGTAQGATFTRDAGTTQSFSNTASIPIDDGHCDDTLEDSVQGQSNPYPSTIDVSGMTGPITDVNVTLKNLSHQYLQDLRAMLVSPDGKKVLFLHGAGNGEVDDVTFKFDDAWDDEALHDSGSVAPSFGDLGCEAVPEEASLPAPAPEGPYDETLGAFNGSQANGQWKLYMVDFFDDEVGVVDGGWSLEITTGITINDGECLDGPPIGVPPRQEPASSYPSTINVAGLSGNVTDVNLTLKNYSHQIPGDVRMLLVGPQGQKVLVVHQVGTIPDDLPGSAIEDQTLVLDDAAAGSIPTPVVGGTYKPTQVDGTTALDQICSEYFPASSSLPAPAPAAPYAMNLGAFNGTAPNGAWSLYIIDDYGDAAGSLDGWSLDITTDDTYAGVVAADAPAGYWRFGEPSGSTVQIDSSGHGNNGTYLGGVTLAQPGALAGNPNTAASYDGVNDTSRIPDAASLDVGPQFTVEGWVKRSSTTKSMELMNKGGNGFQLVVMNAGSGNKVFLRKANVTTIAQSTVPVLADGRYDHIAATINGPGSTARIYVDGVDVTDPVPAGAAQVIQDTPFLLTFGISAATETKFDEFALYDGVLSGARIAAHYAAGVGGI
jgi:subtilisin-like proprotein convertase family protein